MFSLEPKNDNWFMTAERKRFDSTSGECMNMLSRRVLPKARWHHLDQSTFEGPSLSQNKAQA